MSTFARLLEQRRASNDLRRGVGERREDKIELIREAFEAHTKAGRSYRIGATPMTIFANTL